MVRGEEGEKEPSPAEAGITAADSQPAPTAVDPEDSAQDKLTPPGCNCDEVSDGGKERPRY